MGYTGTSTTLGAAGSGANLKVLASFTNKITYDLVARPGIKSPGDLREKRVGVQSNRRDRVDGRHFRVGASRIGSKPGMTSMYWLLAIKQF